MLVNIPTTTAGTLVQGGLPGVAIELFGVPRLRSGVGKVTVEAATLGTLLALGSRRAAVRIGCEAAALVPHVKGLELPGYHPRSLHATALGLVVGTRGSDHNRSGAFEADFSPHPRDAVALASAAVAMEDRLTLIDSLILCKFLRGIFTDLYADSVASLSAVTGWDVSAGELRDVVRRVVNARKCVNQREGWTRAEGTLPPRQLAGGPLPGDELGLSIA